MITSHKIMGRGGGGGELTHTCKTAADTVSSAGLTLSPSFVASTCEQQC